MRKTNFFLKNSINSIYFSYEIQSTLLMTERTLPVPTTAVSYYDNIVLPDQELSHFGGEQSSEGETLPER